MHPIAKHKMKNKRAEKKCGWANIDKIKQDCIYVNLKDDSPTFQVYLSLYGIAFFFIAKAFTKVCFSHILKKLHKQGCCLRKISRSLQGQKLRKLGAQHVKC